MEGVSAQTFPLPVWKQQGYVFALLGKSAAIILDHEERSNHLILPSKIGGRKVLTVSGMNNREELKKVTIEDGVLQICYGFLKDCPSLETLQLPSSIVHVAGELCDRSQRIKKYSVSGEDTAISDEEGVLLDLSKKRLIRYPAAKPDRQYEFPKSVMEICPNAFSGAVHLEKAIVPEGIERIGSYAFFGGAKEVVLPDTLTEIGSRAFFMSNIETIEIPESVMHIGNKAFAYCSGLTEVKMPSQIKIFGDFLFQECGSLETVRIPEGVHKLEGTFYEYRALRRVYIPDSVKEIDKWVFLRDDKKPFKNIMVHEKTGSIAEKFAEENGYEWRVEI